MHIEVKNYDLSLPANRASLYNDVAEQALRRAENLPSGSFQGVIIDIRGQAIDPAVLQRIASNIQQATGGRIRVQDVIFKRQ
jgi:filamentous hemagglutinin